MIETNVRISHHSGIRYFATTGDVFSCVIRDMRLFLPEKQEIVITMRKRVIVKSYLNFLQLIGSKCL